MPYNVIIFFSVSQEFIRLLQIFKNMTIELHKLEKNFLNSFLNLLNANLEQYFSLYNCILFQNCIITAFFDENLFAGYWIYSLKSKLLHQK